MAPKSFKKGPKKGKAADELETENDFLDAADEFEGSMSKWRIGDPEKAARFYYRALDVYYQGLTRYPEDVDLIYNKANLQYRVATNQGKLRDQIGDEQKLLTEALETHLIALKLDRKQTDILFNTAQLLNESAISLYDRDRPSQVALERLLQSIELCEECLTLQEKEYQEGHLQTEQVNVPASAETSEEDLGGETWATVKEPTTASDLIDTAVSLIDSISHAIQIIPDIFPEKAVAASKLADLQVMGELILHKRLLEYVDLLAKEPVKPCEPKKPGFKVLYLQTGAVEVEEEPLSPMKAAKFEVISQTATFQARLALAQGALGIIPAQNLALRLQEIYEGAPADFNPPSFLLEYATMLQEFAMDVEKLATLQEVDEQIRIQYKWDAMEKADQVLGRALEISLASNFKQNTDPKYPGMVNIYLERGNAELFRRKVTLSPQAHISPGLSDQAPRLLRSASLYFLAAEQSGKAEGTLGAEATADAAIRARVTQRMEHGLSVNDPAGYTDFDGKRVMTVITDMLEDELL
jgi:tetratricopeptide (TPR) repeat protein